MPVESGTPSQASQDGANVPSNSSSTQSGVPVKYAEFAGRSASGVMRIGEVDASLLRDTIDAILQDGDAIMFGRTSDGGAVSLSVYSGGRRVSAYYASLATFQDGLLALKQAASTS